MVVIYKIDSCYFKQKDHKRIIKDKEDTFYYIMVLFVYDQLTYQFFTLPHCCPGTVLEGC